MSAAKELVYDKVGDLGIGEVIDRYTNFHDDPKGVEMLTVRFGDGDEAVDADHLLTEVARRGEIYFDTNDIAAAPMPYAAALKIVHDLARRNQIDETDIAFDGEALAEQREWQVTALAVVAALLEGHEADIDAAFRPELSSLEQNYPLVDRAEDASIADVAIRICLDASIGAMLSNEDTEADGMRAEYERQQQAFDLVYDLARLHGSSINELSVTPPSAKP